MDLSHLDADVDLGCLKFNEPLQPVVPVEDATVQIVQIRGREAPTVERHQRAELRRDDRDDLENHPLGLVARLQKRLDDLESLDDLFRFWTDVSPSIWARRSRA